MTAPDGYPAGDDLVVDAPALATDREVAVTSQMVLKYDRVRIGRAGSAFSLFRCVRCRALLEEKLLEQEQHDEWHRTQGDLLDGDFDQADSNTGW